MNRLSKYLVFTSSALGIAYNSEADIIYVNVDPDIDIQDTTYQVDLDSNGVNDVSIFHSHYYYSTSSMIISNSIAGLNGNKLVGDGILEDSPDMEGELIGFQPNFSSYPSDPNSFFKGWWLSGIFFSFGAFNGYTYTYYNPGRILVAGVKFDISGYNHYGWIRLREYNINPNQQSSPIIPTKFVLLDYAYESCPNVPIIGGATSQTYSQCPSFSYQNLSGCDTVYVNDEEYTSNQIVNDTLYGGASSGADSIAIYSIYVKNSVNTYDTISGCNSVLYNNVSYESSTLISDSSINSNGCYLIDNIYLNVKPISHGDTIPIEYCDQANYNGNIYYTSTFVIDTMENQNGCFLETTELIINNSSESYLDTTLIEGESITIGTKVFYNDYSGLIILTNQYNCDSIIHANIIFEDSIINSIEAFKNDITLYPNPFNGTLHLKNIDPINQKIEIYDLLGQQPEVQIQSLSNEVNINIANFQKGVYFLQVKNLSGEVIFRKKIIKE